MTTLGIIGAMQVEVDLLLKAMDRKYGILSYQLIHPSQVHLIQLQVSDQLL